MHKGKKTFTNLFSHSPCPVISEMGGLVTTAKSKGSKAPIPAHDESCRFWPIGSPVRIVQLERVGRIVSVNTKGIQYEVRYFDNAKARTVYFFPDELMWLPFKAYDLITGLTWTDDQLKRIKDEMTDAGANNT